MKSVNRQKHIVLWAVLFVFIPVQTLLGHTASDIIREAGVQGGLVVHLGCGDGKLTTDLRINERSAGHDT